MSQKMKMFLLLVIAAITLSWSSACSQQRTHQAYYPDNTLRQSGTMNGYKPEGLWTTFHKDGSIASQGHFVAGKQDGRWVYGHAQNKPAGVGHWSNGVQHGWWEIKTNSGAVEQRGLMTQGERLGPWIINGDFRVYGDPNQIGNDHAHWITLNSQTQALVGIERVAFMSSWGDSAEKTIVETQSEQFRSWWAQQQAPQATRPQSTSKDAAPLEQPNASNYEAEELNDIASAVSTDSVEISPMPPLIEYGGLVNFLGNRFINQYLDRTEATKMANESTSGSTDLLLGNELGQHLVGKPLPLTRFITDNGSVLDLTKPKQTTVFVMMRGFSGSVCLYCTAQTASFMQMATEFEQANVAVVLCYPGSVVSIDAFKNAVAQLRKDPNTKIPFQLALDVNQRLVSRMNIVGDLAKPASFIIDTNGIIRWAYVGRKMGDRPAVPTLLSFASSLP